MTKLKTVPVEFGPIKTDEQFMVEKIEGIINDQHGSARGYLLIALALLMKNGPIKCRTVELAEKLFIESHLLYQYLPYLRANGLKVGNLGKGINSYEFDYKNKQSN